MPNFTLTESDFDLLKKRYGSHRKVAEALHLSSRQYQRVRAGLHSHQNTIVVLSELVRKCRDAERRA